MFTCRYQTISFIAVAALLFYSCHPNKNKFAPPAAKLAYQKYIYLFERAVDRKKFALAQKYCDSALAAISDYKDDKDILPLYSRALFSTGFTLLEQQNYISAFSYYNHARRLIERTGDSCVFSAYTLMLGSVSDKQGKYLDAAHYTRQGIAELAHCAENYSRFRLIESKLDDIGIFYSRADMPDSALLFFNASLKYLKDNGPKYKDTATSKPFIRVYSGVVYGNMGTAYLKKGDSTTAEKYFIESLRINTEKEFDQGDAQFTWLKLADLYLAKNRLAEAGEELRALKYSLDTLPDPEKKLKYYRLQLNYLGRTGQNKAAQVLLPVFLNLQDSLARVKPIPQVDVSKEYDHLQDQYELALLEKRDALKTASLLFIVSLAIVVVGILLFIWFNLNRSRKHVANLTDLNDRIREHNTQMRKTLSALEQSQKENTRMMQIVAHDLRNPVGGMTMLASLMLKTEGRSVEDVEMLDLIKTSGQNSLELVGDLLQVHARPEDMIKEPVNLKDMLQYCVELLHYKAEAKGQRLELNAVPVTIPVNREKLWRVISNLVANAIKFSANGAVITIKMQRTPANVLIAVEDHGIGIPAEMADKIFNMFTEAKRPGTAGEQPYGLGLAISKQIVEAHGGKIWFESVQDNGTTFYIELPEKK